MTSDSEHTNKQHSPQQAQGLKWPIIVLLLSLAALTLALTACGDSSTTSTPGATSTTGVPEWDETVEFSVGPRNTTHYVEIPVKKCEEVVYHLTASEAVELVVSEPGTTAKGTFGMRGGLFGDDTFTTIVEQAGTLTLGVRTSPHEVRGKTTPITGTISWLVVPPLPKC